MMKYIKLFALLLLFILQSCKKEDEIISYPIVYSNSPTTDNSIKVFTRNGEITDSVLINYFNRKYGFLLTGMNNYNSEGNVLITYLSPEKVELRKSDSDNLDTLSVFKGSDLIYFEEIDTISSPIGLMYDVYYFNKIFKYKPLYYEEFIIPVSSGYSRAAKYKHSYFVKAVDEKRKKPNPHLAHCQAPQTNAETKACQRAKFSFALKTGNKIICIFDKIVQTD